MIKTRIAPSPSGPLHIGTARTALFNYLFAKQNQGEFILRIEDTDKERSESKWEKDIKQGLKWLGFNWDKEYKQSERSKIYKKYIKKLPGYEKDGVIYFKNRGEVISFEDAIRGKIEIEVNNDFIVARSEDQPLYNLACVIDDYEMGISHIIRGEDHIPNTPKQILLQKALNLPTPQYAHLPLILGPDKSKLSKRHGATSVGEYKKDYLPETLINYMALLGWNPGDDREIFSLDKLIKGFSLQKVQKGGAIFNIDKLDWLNAYYIKRLAGERLIKLTGVKAARLEQKRLKRLSEFKPALDFINKVPDYKAELLYWGNMNREGVKNYLNKALARETLNGSELWPPRVAVSGKKSSPPYMEIKKVLGEKETQKRLKRAVEKLSTGS